MLTASSALCIIISGVLYFKGFEKINQTTLSTLCFQGITRIHYGKGNLP
jgi:hypothetical protein